MYCNKAFPLQFYQVLWVVETGLTIRKCQKEIATDSARKTKFQFAVRALPNYYVRIGKKLNNCPTSKQ